MPDRMFRDGWKASARIGSVTEGAECLLTRLILCACNLSRYYADPTIIKGTAFPNRPRLRTSDIASRLDELEKAGLIVRYVAPDGTPLLEIPRFGQNLKFGLKSPFAPRPGGPPDDPGQGLLEIEPPPGELIAPATVKRREEKAPHSPPTTGGGKLNNLETETRPPRRFRTPERRAARSAEIDREIARIRERLKDLYHPGGCAYRVEPTGENATRAKGLQAKWEALEAEQNQLKKTPENTGGEGHE